MNIEILLCNQYAIMPTRATNGSAAYDVYAAEEKYIDTADSAIISTGLRLNVLDKVIAALLLPRSGLSLKGITLANSVGLIDSDYQGEILVNLRNDGPFYTVNKGDRIAQLMFIPILLPTLTEVKEFTTLTVRGQNGFGSTGV